MTLEQFEIGFMRDMNPESELAQWCSIRAAWLAYHEKYFNDEALPDEEERHMLGALIAISTGVNDLMRLDVPKEFRQRLIQCYDDLMKQGEARDAPIQTRYHVFNQLIATLNGEGGGLL